MSARYTRAGLTPGGHTGTQVARREAAMEQVRKLLAAQPRSAFDLSAQLQLPSSTIYGYLRAMEDLGEARQLNGVDARGRKLWAADERALDEAAEKVSADHASRAWVVKAQQIGMQRDPMIAALFGPAPQQ